MHMYLEWVGTSRSFKATVKKLRYKFNPTFPLFVSMTPKYRVVKRLQCTLILLYVFTANANILGRPRKFTFSLSFIKFGLVVLESGQLRDAGSLAFTNSYCSGELKSYDQIYNHPRSLVQGVKICQNQLTLIFPESCTILMLTFLIPFNFKFF